jgi:LPXTG-site transpeptidase (sortase) family protein
MSELEKWVVRYPWSVKPGEIWNSFIFWHSSNFPWVNWEYNDVFSLLNNVTNWDDIIIYYNQKKYVYTIKQKNVISPWNVSIFKWNKTKAQVMIMTCWPIWTTLNRLVVTWELKKD